MTRGKLPLGIQNFEELRKGGYLLRRQDRYGLANRQW